MIKNIKNNQVMAFNNNDIITNKEKALHTEDEINFLIEFLNDPAPTKKYFYYLERLSFSTCIYAVWDHVCEKLASDAWKDVAPVVTKNSLKYLHVSNDIDCYNNMLIDADIDRIIEHACNTEKSILVVVTPGTTLKDKTAMTKVWPYFEQNKNALLMAHVLDNAARKNDPSYYWTIHPQFFAINLVLYKQIGRPKFNQIMSDSVTMGDRSHENFHDNYTPFYIKPNNQTVANENFKFGYASNIINEGLKQGCEIINVPTTIRNEKKFHYPENTGAVSNLELYNFNILHNFHGGWDYVYTFNTESYFNELDMICPVTYYKDGKFEIKIYDNFNEFKSSHIVDSFVTVSSGWAGDWYNHLFNYRGEDVCYFDINTASLFYKKLLIEKWQGPKFKLLGDFLYDYGNFTETEIFFNLINLTPPASKTKWRDSLNQYCQDIIDPWGLDLFQNYFDNLRRSKKWFMSNDIIHNPAAWDNFNLVRKKNYQTVFGSNILDNRMYFYQNGFNKDKIYNATIKFFDRMPGKTIYIGNNISGLYCMFYDKKVRPTKFLVKE